MEKEDLCFCFLLSLLVLHYATEENIHTSGQNSVLPTNKNEPSSGRLLNLRMFFEIGSVETFVEGKLDCRKSLFGKSSCAIADLDCNSLHICGF